MHAQPVAKHCGRRTGEGLENHACRRVVERTQPAGPRTQETSKHVFFAQIIELIAAQGREKEGGAGGSKRPQPAKRRVKGEAVGQGQGKGGSDRDNFTDPGEAVTTSEVGEGINSKEEGEKGIGVERMDGQGVGRKERCDGGKERSRDTPSSFSL